MDNAVIFSRFVKLLFSDCIVSLVFCYFADKKLLKNRNSL